MTTLLAAVFVASLLGSVHCARVRVLNTSAKRARTNSISSSTGTVANPVSTSLMP